MKKSKFSLGVKIIAILSFVIAVFGCGYFSLDKIIIPRNFSHYGINGVRDLTNVFASLYGVPKESKIIVNGYGEDDLENAVSKLQEAGYKIEDDGTIVQENLASFNSNSNKAMMLTDSEMVAVFDSLVQSGLLVDNLTNLKYIDLVDIEVIDLVITPLSEETVENYTKFNNANVKFIIKVNTEHLCEQMAEQMQTTEAILNVIIPNNLYFTIDYDINLGLARSSRAQGLISINNKSAEKSEVLLNLLISFIFPEEDEMTIEKFTSAIGDVALSGIDELGDFSFVCLDKEENEYGLIFS